MTDRTIHLAVARAEGENIRLFLTVDGKPNEFLLARHVAASTIEALARALAS